MLSYFPLLHDRYEMAMDVRGGVTSLIEVEKDKFAAQVALKHEIIASDASYYVQYPVDTEALAWEALEVLLPNMAERLSQYFTLERRGDAWTWTNQMSGTTHTFQFGNADTLPCSPLEWIGRQIQEDLILMRASEDGAATLCAGLLCFGAGWCLEDKMRRPFLQIHDPVPGFHEQIGTPADLLLRRLKPYRSAGRLNWSITSTDQLDLAPRLAAQWQMSRYGMTPQDVGRRVCFRVERQTLTRLPRTEGTLFTIHTYVNTLDEVVADEARLRRLTNVLHGYPNALKEYKGMTPYFNTMMAYLDARLDISPSSLGYKKSVIREV